jgi:hypothetical protein
MTSTSELASAIAWCKRQPDPYNAFNSAVLLRGAYWSGQRQISAALCDPDVDTIVVQAGHSVGKSFEMAGLLLAWLTLHADSGVMSTGPANTQLSTVLWAEIEKSRGNSPYLDKLGHMTKRPNELKYGPQWKALGYSTNKNESMAGFHPTGPLLNLFDEASGVEDADTWATLKSLNPLKTVAIGNPLRPEGPFFELCMRAQDDPRVRLVKIPSTASPDARILHSTRGLADLHWLRGMAADYGVGSPIWQCRVAAEFPSHTFNQLIPPAWVNRCISAAPTRKGRPRISIDLAGGNGGDRAVVLVVDDNGVLDYWASNVASIGATAEKAGELARKWGVPGERVTYDKGGAGLDFQNRLDQIGLPDAFGYVGGSDGGPRFANLRTSAAWAMHDRLDPGRSVEGRRDRQDKFHIPAALAAAMRPELQGLRYSIVSERKLALELKELLAKRIKRSPDLADALLMAFANLD